MANLFNMTGVVIMLIVLACLVAGLVIIINKTKNREPETDGPFAGGVTIKRQKRRKAGPSFGSVAIVIVIVIIAAAVFPAYTLYKYCNENEAFEELAMEFTSVDSTAQSWENMISVDFEGLMEQNPDVAAWLYVENTNISYPVMYSGDDSTYSNFDFYKNNSVSGSIFLEKLNNTDFSDSHTIIYGNSMKYLSDYGNLNDYKSEEGFYDGHKYFQIILPDGTRYRYEIFSYFDTTAGSFVYAVPYSDSEDFSGYIDNLISSSSIQSDTEVTSKDKLVTLSAYSFFEKRFVVNGVLVDTK